jgi:hypothetical protein
MLAAKAIAARFAHNRIKVISVVSFCPAPTKFQRDMSNLMPQWAEDLREF